MNNFAGKLGIVRTRDLVELYFGARAVVAVRTTVFTPDAGAWVKILQQDMRRIRYELSFPEGTNNTVNLSLSTQPNFDQSIFEQYILAPFSNLIVKRNWLTDMEGVTLPLWANISQASETISVRETFLTPPPVDEDLTD